MDPWQYRFGMGELLIDRRIFLQQPFPCGIPLGEIKLISQWECGGNSRAGNAVIEAQHPHPAAWKNMVHRRIIDGIGSGFIVRNRNWMAPQERRPTRMRADS